MNENENITKQDQCKGRQKTSFFLLFSNDHQLHVNKRNERFVRTGSFAFLKCSYIKLLL